MNLLGRLLAVHTPGVVKGRILDELFAATARGFGRPAPSTAGLSRDGRLAAYARFTRDEVERAIDRGGDLSGVRDGLHSETYALGVRMRRIFGVEGPSEALAVARPLYRAIGIDVHGTAAGEVTVSRCYFADHYTPGICRLVSALDEGMLAGLAGGGRLVFRERLTEGADRCRARFFVDEAGVSRPTDAAPAVDPALGPVVDPAPAPAPVVDPAPGPAVHRVEAPSAEPRT